MNEHAAVLIGYQRGRLWYGRLRQKNVGQPACVLIDWTWTLDREEHKGDVIGFFHTHPAGSPAPSDRDVRTLRAWCSCLGKPLLCVIECGAQLRAYRFQSDWERGHLLSEVQKFPRSVIIAVESEVNHNV